MNSELILSKLATAANTRVLDLSKQRITSLTQLVGSKDLATHLKSIENLQTLDLSQNKLQTLMLVAPARFNDLSCLNIMNNPFTNVKHEVDLMQTMTPNLRELQMSLTDVADVDYLLNRLPHLERLNNIPVERGDSCEASQPQ